MLFSFLLIILLTHYFFYPFFLFLQYRLNVSKEDRDPNCGAHPSISIIVAALNEEKVIEKKIINLHEVNYPKDKIEIIVVADGSTDRTVEILEKRFSESVRVLFQSKRMGKAHALNRAVASAENSIIIFTDANAYLKQDALKILVRHFSDANIGGVSGNKVVLKSGARECALGDHTYRSFESTMKTWQSASGSISTAGGELFAVRRHLYQPLAPETINDDMEITYGLVSKGYRVIFEQNAITTEEASHSLSEDLNVKARIVLGGYQFLKRYRKDFLYPRSAFILQLTVHKIVRWIMPILLVLIFISTVSLVEKSLLLKFFLVGQALFLLMALAGYALKTLHRPLGLFYLPFYYCYVNYGALQGLYYFALGRTGVSVWKRAAR